jgi:putative amidoligase enzyme
VRLSDRTFGVEIECGGPREAMLDAVERKLGFYPSCHSDGSGNEIHTRVLSGERGMREFKTMMDTLRNAGGWTSMSDGMHVHHGAWDFYSREDLQARLAQNWVNMLDAIESIIAPYRRGGYSACRQQFWQGSCYYRRGEATADYVLPTSRGALNLNNLQPTSMQGQHARTIEFRLHEGTLHTAYAEAWIRMTQALLDRTVESKSAFRTCSSVVGLGNRLGLDKEVVEVLKEKAATITDPPDSITMRAEQARREEALRRAALERELRRHRQMGTSAYLEHQFNAGLVGY